MARELFPHKKPGDSLAAEHVNNLSQVAKRFSRLFPGTNQSGIHSDSMVSIATMPPFTQYTLRVSDTTVDDEDTEDSGLYLVEPRWYNFVSEEWETDEGNAWLLDTTEFPTYLFVGDKIPGYWSDQRSAFIPLWVPQRFRAVVTEPSGINPDSTGSVVIWRASAQTTRGPEDAWFKWLYAEDELPPGQRVVIQYYADELDGVGAWIIEIPWCAA